MNGEVLKKFFEETGLNQTEFAKRLGISQAALSQMFTSGKARSTTLEKFCDTLNLKMNDLYAGTKYAIEVGNEAKEDKKEEGVNPLFKYILEERDQFKEENSQYKKIIRKLEEENKRLKDLLKKESLAS